MYAGVPGEETLESAFTRLDVFREELESDLLAES